MHKDLRVKDNLDRQYVSRKEGGRGLASIEDSVDASIRGLEDKTEKSKERLITATRISTNNIMSKLTTKEKLTQIA